MVVSMCVCVLGAQVDHTEIWDELFLHVTIYIHITVVCMLCA